MQSIDKNAIYDVWNHLLPAVHIFFSHSSVIVTDFYVLLKSYKNANCPPAAMVKKHCIILDLMGY